MGVKTLEVCRLAAVLAVLLGCCGCNPAALRDTREDRDPLLRRAQAKRRAQDYDGAIEGYYKALARRPDLGRAHLELGLIFDQQKNDPIRAIYHYQRYLEERPEAEKKELVQDLIQHARLTFAASLPDRPSEAVREIAFLRLEIEALKAQLASRPPVPVLARPASPAAPPRPAPGPPAVAAPAPALAPVPPPPAQPGAGPVDSYVVLAGDTLSRIAGKVYGDPGKWEIIYNANRATMPSPQSLRAGQTLVIPRP
jgi:tetratricopeptide (TPR) repeat protein